MHYPRETEAGCKRSCVSASRPWLGLRGKGLELREAYHTIMSGGRGMPLINATNEGVIFSSAYQTGCCFTCGFCNVHRVGTRGIENSSREGYGKQGRAYQLDVCAVHA